MKKIFFLLLTIGLFFDSFVLAQDLGGSALDSVAKKANIQTNVPLESRVGNIISSILALLGTIFLILTIYAGILWMTASGEEKQIEKAKEILKAAIIGLAIVLSAYTITYFVGSRLGSSTPSNRSGSCAPADVCESAASEGYTRGPNSACSPNKCEDMVRFVVYHLANKV